MLYKSEKNVYIKALRFNSFEFLLTFSGKAFIKLLSKTFVAFSLIFQNLKPLTVNFYKSFLAPFRAEHFLSFLQPFWYFYVPTAIFLSNIFRRPFSARLFGCFFFGRRERSAPFGITFCHCLFCSHILGCRVEWGKPILQHPKPP